MTRIELNPYDRDDLIKYLEYAEEQKIQNKPVINERNKWDDTRYDTTRINYLIDIIKGKIHSGGISMTSSLPITSEKDKEQVANTLERHRKEKEKKQEIEPDDDLLSFLYEEDEEPWWKN